MFPKFAFVLALTALALVACGGGGGNPTVPGGGGGGLTITMEFSSLPPNPRCGTEAAPGTAVAGDVLMFPVDVDASASAEVLVEPVADGSTTRMPVMVPAGTSMGVPVGITFNTPGTLARVYPRVDLTGFRGPEVECWIVVQ